MTDHDTEGDGLGALLRSLDAGDRMGCRIIENRDTGAAAFFPRTVPDLDQWQALSDEMHADQEIAVAADPRFQFATDDDDAEAEPATTIGRFQVTRV